jgi:hypothetical protein
MCALDTFVLTITHFEVALTIDFTVCALPDARMLFLMLSSQVSHTGLDME